MNFSILLKELRTDKAISQAKLAEILGLTQDSVSLWEKGKSIPATPYLIKLADYFNVSTDYLLGRTDELGEIVPNPSPTVPGLGEISLIEKQLISYFRKLPAETQDYIFGITKNLAK